eukprot:CAMPEP_0113642870 /NCGR_PEP_ID=MMETSP0017_2-20120614/22525_1 /TAXON_ID=2856 /ORGANISM="Cylindrotheca closterium" /LENGTH=895 /DNA_ID=CAMNT_0000554323 /DNA_START=34 /DNA_END=2721 /DNA_ORIENTATION=+ /assembly_acc=CAM_ASM_000147
MRHLIQQIALIITIQLCSCHGWTIRGGSANITASRYSHSEVVPSMETKRKLQDDELRFCYNALFASDSNDDRALDRSEYITFIDLIGGPRVDTYSDLPIVFRSSFSILACRCLEDPKAAPDCCVGNKARVSNAGSGPDENPSKREEQNLYHVCFLSESSVDKFMSERDPTTSPTKAPTKTPTPPPTGKPTEEVILTDAPTPGPTPNPTVSPTETPTIRPTFAPNPFPTTPLPTVAPTFKPTQTPTPAPTIASSVSPTVMASGVPTVATSGTPSASPTTATPSGVPSMEPSVAPSVVPSGTPSALPSIAPSQGPSAIPSDHPTMAPSLSSAPSSSAAPTNVPSTSPSLSPSRTPPDENMETTYVIAVRGSALLSEYESDLIESMNLLAQQVADDVADGTTERRRLVSVSIFNPTSLESIDPTDCPDTVESDDDRCESVTATVGLYVDGEEEEGSTVTRFKESLEASIENGELQEALDFVNEDSPVYVVTGRESTVIPRGKEPESSLSTGVISGIVVAGVVGLAISILIMQKRKDREDEPKEDDYDLEGGGMEAGEAIMVDTSEVDNKPQKKKISPKSDDSSIAGDSGWSSHGGMSSLDTSSVDDDSKYRTAALGGAALAGGAVAGGALDKEEPTSPTETNNDLKMTYSELDDAIQEGDWAAVGVTAALLASQSYETGSSSDTHRLSIDNATLNPSRAAELDRLVVAGDWEGVVAAAAKFDAQEATTRIERSESASRASSSDATSNASGSIASSGSPSNSEGVTAGATSTSESGSARKLDEIRKEVDDLVRQVVPEEQDNVDEMMLQFQGREEELVETLRSMQERQVVQKARIEGQKKAKRDARDQVQSSKKQTDGDTGTGEDQTKTETDIAESLNTLSNTNQEDDHFEDDDDEGSV